MAIYGNMAKKNILSNLINNAINWNNTISNLWGQSSKKILQLTEQHEVSLDLLSNTLKNVNKVKMCSMLSNAS